MMGGLPVREMARPLTMSFPRLQSPQQRDRKTKTHLFGLTFEHSPCLPASKCLLEPWKTMSGSARSKFVRVLVGTNRMLGLVTASPKQPSQQSAPRTTAALAQPCRPQTIICRGGVHLLDGGLPRLMDSIRRCRTGG